MSAIPTTYAGVRFRSRLEARWAAFFDAVGWPWQYEPVDLAGYIPDFIIPLGWAQTSAPLLVEVKPVLYAGQLYDHVPKIRASGWRDDFLVVGGLIFEVAASGHDVLGIYGRHDTEVIDYARTFGCEMCGRMSFCTEAGLRPDDNGGIAQIAPRRRTPCRLCGDTGALAAGGHAVDLDREGSTRSAYVAWGDAGNAVQWRGGR